MITLFSNIVVATHASSSTLSHPVDLPEEGYGIRQRLHQRVDLPRGVVQVQTRPRRRRDLKVPVQRLRAVMPAPRRHPSLVQQRAHVVGVQPLHVERR